MMPAELKSAAAFYAYLGVGKAEQDFLAKHAQYRYRPVKIPKRRGGTRTLLVPERRLKYMQRKTLLLLEQLYKPRVPVHGFVEDRSPITNADKHQRRPFLLNLDLSNFFGVITRGRVWGMLVAIGVDGDTASAVCDVCVANDQLPQGAPTSPILSNLVAYRLDRDLMVFAKANRLRYTRYADDLTFSSQALPTALFEGPIPTDFGRLPVAQLSPTLLRAIKGNGFQINADKVWFAGRKARKEVTGLVVNEFVNVKRTLVRDVRASLYKLEKLGVAVAEADYRKRYNTNARIVDVVRGRLEWLAQVRGRSFTAYRTLAKRYNDLFPTAPLQIDPTYQEIAERAVWVVEYEETDASGKITKYLQGTAFFLDHVGLVTCHHVLEDMPAGAIATLFRPSAPGRKFQAKLTAYHCAHRDLAILDHDVPAPDHLSLPATSSPANTNDEIIALGFPSYGPGDQLGYRKGVIIAHAMKSAVKHIEVNAQLAQGISGAPVVNERFQVIGIARRGGPAEPKQMAVDISELLALHATF